jgi:hypothetical protein
MKLNYNRIDINQLFSNKAEIPEPAPIDLNLVWSCLPEANVETEWNVLVS